MICPQTKPLLKKKEIHQIPPPPFCKGCMPIGHLSSHAFNKIYKASRENYNLHNIIMKYKKMHDLIDS